MSEFFAWPDERPVPDSSPITIRTRRPMLLRRIGEDQLRHAEAGSEITTTCHEIRCIDPADFEIVQTPL